MGNAKTVTSRLARVQFDAFRAKMPKQGKLKKMLRDEL
jgi:hypothetical protein